MTPVLFDSAPEPSADHNAAALKRVHLGKRFIEIPGREQMSFEVRQIDDFVPEDAPVRVVSEIVELIDLSALEATHTGGGRPAFPPRFMAGLLFFGYFNGINSAREISRRIDHDVRFMWLAREMTLDHQRLSEFRRAFREPLKGIFKQIVRLCMQVGLVSLNIVAIDGSKITASAKKKALNKDELARALREVDAYIEKLMAKAEATDAAEDELLGEARGDELPEDLAKAQGRRDKLLDAQKALEESDRDLVSVTDPQAPVQKIGDSKRPGYNGQLAVDAESGVAVAQDVTTDQNDTEQFEPMINQTAENTGLLPDAAPADGGYHSKETLEFIEGSGVNGYINQPSADPDGRYGHDDFQYDEDTDTYTCPGGHPLAFKGTKTLRDTDYKLYRAAGRLCKNCPHRARCLSEKARCRELLISPHEDLVAEMRRKIATEQGKRALQRRKETVEPTFGTMKAVLGLRQFLLRGFEGAQIEFGLCAIAINLRKLAKSLADCGARERLDLALQAG